MGDSASNCYLIAHRQAGADVGVSYRHHLGNVGLDTTSPELSPSAYASVRVAAIVSQSAFDAAMGASALGSWYANRPSGWREDARVHTRRYDPSAA